MQLHPSWNLISDLWHYRKQKLQGASAVSWLDTEPWPGTEQGTGASQSDRGLCPAQVTPQPLTAHQSVLLLCAKKKFCFCTKQSWVPTKAPPKLSERLLSTGRTKPHEQATRESNRIHSKQEGKTKIIPSLQDNPLLPYISSVVIVRFTHRKPHRIQDKLPHPTASASCRHKRTLIKHLNVNITNPKWNRWGRKNAKICLVFQCPVFWLDA